MTAIVEKHKKIMKDGVTFALLIAVVFSMSALTTVADEVSEDLREAVEDSVTNREILWFARTIYSETKKKEEQLLIAWVIRNRVESQKFPDTYEAVVRQPRQFSGLNPSDQQYWVNVGMQYGESGPGWDSALAVAEAVYSANSIFRPFATNVLHFYSPRSVASTPSWAADIKATHVVRDTETESIRFALYAGVK